MRVAAVLATIVLVFVLSYLAACVAAWPFATSEMTVMNNDFLMISSALAAFAKAHGGYPESLDELAGIEEGRHLFDETGRLRYVDPWRNPYQYERTERDYRLYSLGRDGKPGGEGLDADLEYDPRSYVSVKPTFRQFLFDMPESGAAITLAFWTSLCAGLACYFSTAPREGRQPVRLRAVVNMAVVTVAAVFVAFILALIYLTGEHH